MNAGPFLGSVWNTIGDNETPLDLAGASHGTIDLHKEIPETAREVLVYAWAAAGAAEREVAGDVVFSVKNREAEAGFKLRLHSYHQNAWAFNSDNFWLPIPPNRLLHWSFSEPIGGNANGGVGFLAWR